MDAPDVDPRLLRKSLRFIRIVNSLLGYTRATMGHLERFSKSWGPGESISMIDIATGSAGIPRAILAWANRREFNVRIVGIDRHAQTVRAAARGLARDDRLNLVQADALQLPFADASFDYALTAMFLHHLSDDQAA